MKTCEKCNGSNTITDSQGLFVEYTCPPESQQSSGGDGGNSEPVQGGGGAAPDSEEEKATYIGASVVALLATASFIA